MAHVSAILPYYNGDIDLLGQTVAGILAQTHEDLNLILIDDGSKDELSALIPKAIVAQAPDRIQIIRKHNEGQGVARIVGAKVATAEYLAFCDADDLWHPQKLERQLEFLEKNPEFDAVVHPMLKIDDSGALVGKVEVPFDAKANPTALATFLSLLYNNPFPTSSVFCKREAFIKALPFVITGKDINNDRTLWLAMAWNGSRFGLMDECLGSYRVHEQNFSKEIFTNYNHKFAHIFHFLNLAKETLIKHGYNFDDIEKNVLHHTFVRYASRLYKSGHRKEAIKALRESLRYKPSFNALRRYVKYALSL